MRALGVIQCLFFFVCLIGESAAEDVVEFLSGTHVRGKVSSIRKEAKEFDFETTVGSRTLTRTFAYDKVEAVTINGVRYLLNQKSQPAATAGSIRRSKAEVNRLIEQQGKSPPAWLQETPLSFPASLDLSWPLQPPTEDWNAEQNVSQYLWTHVNPNPGRWKSGVKLVHHILPQHRGAPELLARDMSTLGEMYFRFFQDYARAAFWYQKGGVEQGTPPNVRLAECYWRLGNEAMALELLTFHTLPPEAIKVLSDMGQTRAALQVADDCVRAGRIHDAYLLAGDACRAAGRLDDAIEYYQKVLAAYDTGHAEYQRRITGRARESIEALKLRQQADPSRVADGTYTATTTAFAGLLELEVKVTGGHIESVQVTKHQEKQFFTALTDVPRQIVARQSIEGIDAITGATITSQAIVNGAARALADGAR